MKRFALVALLAALIFGVASSASATELKVKGNIDVYGMWSANLVDHNSDVKDGDNYMTIQRMRTYFDFVASENLKAVLGLEMDMDWGVGDSGDWGGDGNTDDPIEVKHAYLDFTFPDSAVNVKAGLQYVALPSVFGNPIFEDDAAALIVSAPITDMIGVAAGYSRGIDGSTNVGNDVMADGTDKDDVDMAFLAVPVTLDGFAATPYFAYAWLGENSDGNPDPEVVTLITNDFAGPYVYDADMVDDATVWAAGINAELTMFDPLTFAADLIYASMDADDYETAGWYAALAATYKFDFMTATLFGTYATGHDADGNDDDDIMPTLREGWGLSPYVGGVRAFSTSYDSFGTDAVGIGSAGTGLWTVGLVLDNISFVENLSHTLTIAYGQGTSDEDAAYAMIDGDDDLAGRMVFTEKDSCWEVYLVNKYMIYENLAAINELGYFKAESDLLDDVDYDVDASYFATIGFQYKF